MLPRPLENFHPEASCLSAVVLPVKRQETVVVGLHYPNYPTVGIVFNFYFVIETLVLRRRPQRVLRAYRGEYFFADVSARENPVEEWPPSIWFIFIVVFRKYCTLLGGGR